MRNASRPRQLLLSMIGLLCSGLVGCPLGFDVAENGGIGGTGISQGPIDGFGSIFVNGVEWETDSAEIVLDDAPSIQQALRLGMVVRIQGTLSADGTRGQAQRVVFDDEVEGPISREPIETVPGMQKEFDVLGRTVVVDVDFTTFDGTASFDELEAEDMVEVSGLTDGDGRILASRVEGNGRLDPRSSLGELKGEASRWTPDDSSTGVFSIDGVTISYDARTVLDGLMREDLAATPYVEVEGLLTSLDAIHALRIQLEDQDFQAADGEAIELTGFVTDFVSPADFEIMGLAVDASTAEIDEGLVLGDGALVQIKGRLRGGLLVADDVGEADDFGNDVWLAGAATNVDPAVRTLEILGVTIRTHGRTKLKDRLFDVKQFGFDDIVEGDWLEIKGDEIPGEPSAVLASRIERQASNGNVELKGRVTYHDLMQGEIEILGIELPLSIIAGGTRFFDELDVEIDLTEFEALLDAGGEVSVMARDRNANGIGPLREVDELEFEGWLQGQSDDD